MFFFNKLERSFTPPSRFSKLEKAAAVFTYHFRARLYCKLSSVHLSYAFLCSTMNNKQLQIFKIGQLEKSSQPVMINFSTFRNQEGKFRVQNAPISHFPWWKRSFFCHLD